MLVLPILSPCPSLFRCGHTNIVPPSVRVMYKKCNTNSMSVLLSFSCPVSVSVSVCVFTSTKMSSNVKMLLRISLSLLVLCVLTTAYSTEHYRPYRRPQHKLIGYPIEPSSYRSSIGHNHQQQLYFYPQHPRPKPSHYRPKPVYSSKINRHKKYYKSNRYQSKIVKVPVKTNHQIHYRDYPTKPVQHVYYPQMIEVQAPALPVNIIFRSTSSKINVKQVHQPALYEDNHKNTYSVDEAHVLKVLSHLFRFQFRNLIICVYLQM